MRTLRFTAALCALVACSEDPVRFRGVPPPADASMDGATADAAKDASVPRMCEPGRWYCQGAQMAIRCDGDGGLVATERCTDGARCVGGSIACGACTPGTTRCNPENVDAPQLCATDGSGWEDHLACDTSSGERCIDGTCRRPCGESTVVENSYLGCEYWATPTANSGVNYSFMYAVVLANPGAQEAHVSVIGGRLGAAIERTVPPGGVERIELPWIDVLKGSTAACHPLPLGLDCQSRSAFARPSNHAGAYRVTSDRPVAAYQFNPLEYRIGMGSSLVFSYTADASLLLPQNVLGDPRNQEYIVATSPNWGRDPISPPYGGFVAIVGGGPEGDPVEIQVDTTATVGDPNNRARTLAPGRHAFSLARGEVLQLVGTRYAEDLTGTNIRANGPVAVFAGHDCTNIPAARVACDHLEEQILPLATWGRRYAVTFLRDRRAEPNEASVVRVMSQANGNRLTFDGIDIPPTCDITLDRGRFCEFTTSENFVVSGRDPILVTQFMTGQGQRIECTAIPGAPPTDSDDCVGDPAMVIEVPIEQFRNRYDILIPSTYRANFVNLVTPVGTAVTLDGEALADDRVRGPFPVGTGLEVRVLRIDGGAHTLATPNGMPFGAKVYGVGAYTSYMYPGGLDLRPINPPG